MGARARPYDFHCTSGEHTLDPVRRVSGEPIEAEELVVLDFLPKVDHYFADIVRIVTVGGEPSAEQSELQTTVLAPLDHIEADLRRGLRASEVSAMFREFFADWGVRRRLCLPHRARGGQRLGPADHVG